jgi:hypothetical protein
MVEGEGWMIDVIVLRIVPSCMARTTTSCREAKLEEMQSNSQSMALSPYLRLKVSNGVSCRVCNDQPPTPTVQERSLTGTVVGTYEYPVTLSFLCLSRMIGTVILDSFRFVLSLKKISGS